MATSFAQKLRFKSQPEERIDDVDFVGGLVTDVNETKLDKSQSPDMANVVFTDTRSIKTRNGYLRYNGDPVGISADQSNTGASTGSLALTDGSTYVAQTFQASGTIACVQVDAYLAMNTSGQQQYVRAELWSTSASAPSALLTAGQILLVSGTSETAYNFRFNIPTTLTTGVTYAIVIRPFLRGNSTTVNQVNVYHRGSTYANGTVYTSANTGVTWTQDSAKDLRFVVYSGGDTGSTSLIRYYNTSGVKQMFGKFGSSLYRGTDLTGAMTQITMPSGVSIDATNVLDYTIVNDTLLVVDGTNYIKKYRGSTNANYTTGAISVSTGSNIVTGSGTSWNTSTNAAVGEYIKLPDGKWYKITLINSDTSLNIEVSYAAGSASGQTYTISPWGDVQGQLETATTSAGLVRPQPQFIENHINRIWTLEDNTLRFSVLDTSVNEEHFNDWDTTNNAGSIIIPAGSGDSCTGMYSLGGSLYIFLRHSIWVLRGNSPASFELRNVTNEIGMINQATLVEWNNVLIFLSDLGIYMFDGSNLRNLSDGIVNTLIDDWNDKTKARAVLWKNNYLISYPTSAATYNDEVLVYNFKNGTFGKMEGIYASSWVVWSGGTDVGEVYFGSSNQGSIYKFDTGGHDDGYEIETRYTTPSLGYSSGMHDKAIKKFYIQQLALGNWSMSVTQTGNITETITTGAPIDLSPGNASLWDVALWDVAEWSGEGAIVTSRIAEFQGINKYFKFKITQTGYAEGIEVLGITATARTRRLQ